MQRNSTDEPRNVIPRWRSLLTSASWEIAAARKDPDLKLSSPETLAEELQSWRLNRTVESAADIMALGIATGDDSLIREGGMHLLSKGSEIQDRLIDLTQRLIRPKEPLAILRQKRAILEESVPFIRTSIRMLKKRVHDFPRDPVSTLELARYYTILGQYEIAHHWLMRAHHLAPQSRLVLRAMVGFGSVVGELNESLRYLWKSDGLRYDPLIQSAEMAAANAGARASRSAARVKSNLLGRSSVAKPFSEAALALATLEQSHGSSERAVFKFVSAGLTSPTENAVAQAVWVAEQSTRKLKARFPTLHVQEEAYEARAYLLFDSGHYEMSISAASDWSRDQPFQADPMTFICTSAAIYIDDPLPWLSFADRIVDKHAGDFQAVNAAMLLYVAAGVKSRADECLEILRRLASSRSDLAFLAAGRGLVAYRFNEYARGQKQYLDAIKMARKAKRPDLTFSAAVFFLWNEVRYGHASFEEIEEAIRLFNKTLFRLRSTLQSDSWHLWNRVKHNIAERIKNSSSNIRLDNSDIFSDLPLLLED